MNKKTRAIILFIFIGVTVGLKSKVTQNITSDIKVPDTKVVVVSEDVGLDKGTDADLEGLEIIDTIKAVVMNSEGTEIITLSDLNSPSITGVLESLDEQRDKAIVYLETVARKISIPDEEIDRSFVEIEKNNNMTRDDLENLFIGMGSSWEKMKEVFKRMKASKMLIDHTIKSHLVVPRKAIIAYYEQNPEWLDVSYTLKRAFVPSDKVENDTIKTEDIIWSLPFTVLDSDLAQDKYMIKNLSLEETSEPIKIEGGFELFYLVAKQERRLKTLEERYADIADILRKPRYIELLDGFMKELMAKSYVKYL